MPFVDIGTTTLRYDLRKADGPLLVLVHEMGGTLESWDAVLPRLDPGIAVLRYDTRGAGLSGKIRGPVSFSDMSSDLAALLDRAAPGERVLLCGCAVGGGIVLDFAALHPDRVRGVVAMAPATSIPEDRRASAAAFVAAIRAEGMAARVERAVAQAFPPELDLPTDVLSQYRARWLGNDPHSYGEIYHMLCESTLDDRLARIAVPTLLVAGELDATRPPATVERLRERMPAAAILAIRSGHYMPVQTPRLVADLLNRFCQNPG